jgi:hypothetical protein
MTGTEHGAVGGEDDRPDGTVPGNRREGLGQGSRMVIASRIPHRNRHHHRVRGRFVTVTYACFPSGVTATSMAPWSPPCWWFVIQLFSGQGGQVRSKWATNRDPG